MSVIFRYNTLSIIFIALVVILISCPQVQTKVIYSGVYNDDSFQGTIGAYDDGTILFGIKVHHKDNLTLIRPNGTLELINNTKIHCKLSCTYDLLNPNYVIILENGNNVGTIIDWMGNIILKSFKYDKIGISEKNDRFLIMRHNKFTEYHIDHNGEIANITSTTSLRFSKNHKKHLITKIFSLDNAWGIIYSVKKKYFFSIIQSKSKNETLINEELKDLEDASPKCITNDHQVDIEYHCLYRTHYNHTLKLVNIKNLSLNDNTFNLDSTNLFPDIGFDTQTNIHIIPNVGFLVEATANLETKYYIFNTFEIDYFDPNNAFGEWIISNNNNDLIGNNIFILPNKTTVQIIKKGKNVKFATSNKLSSKIPKKNSYNNTHIKSVYPSNNELINNGTSTLNITFLNDIDPTTAAYISIYYDTGSESILRQKFLCTSPYCIISKDNLLTINLSKNTFNMPNATYYVVIDDKFVEYKYEHIKIPGVRMKNWIIKTSEYQYSKKDDNFILGKLRLNTTGTEEFQKMTDADKDDFFDKMRIELWKNIPVDDSRIKKIKNKDEFDVVSGVKLSTFFFQIEPPNEDSFNKKSSKEILEDLNSLIKTKDFITNLDNNIYTKNIDKDYGFQKANDPLEELNISLKNFFMVDRRYLIIIIVCLILIIILYFYGRYKNKKGTNIIVFKVVLIIIDLVNDIRFVIKLKTNLSNLFIPSVMFLLIPFILNVFFAIAIFKFEMQSSKNSEWFKNHIKPVAIATILSSGDIELLHIFDSNFGGFRIFSAKFSPKTLTLIFWGGFLNIILENLPQLVIQILYVIDSSTVYDVSALFTLITSILVFLVSVIECSYHIFMSNKNENHVGIQSDCNEEKDIKH